MQLRLDLVGIIETANGDEDGFRMVETLTSQRRTASRAKAPAADWRRLIDLGTAASEAQALDRKAREGAEHVAHAALAHPAVAIRRARGSDGRFIAHRAAQASAGDFGFAGFRSAGLRFRSGHDRNRRGAPAQRKAHKFAPAETSAPFNVRRAAVQRGAAPRASRIERWKWSSACS
jgi:hypothetical protein